MKTFAITLETLGNGNVRATGRNNGRAVAMREAKPEGAREAVQAVMATTLFAHSTGPGVYDLEYVSMNEAARAALA